MKAYTTARFSASYLRFVAAAGFVARVPHPTDRRATVVELTEEGRAETAVARRALLERLAAAFGRLSLEGQQAYADVLGRLSAGFCP